MLQAKFNVDAHPNVMTVTSPDMDDLMAKCSSDYIRQFFARPRTSYADTQKNHEGFGFSNVFSAEE